MYTLGYSFRPWEQPKAIADGPSIRSYIHEAAAENGLERPDPLQTRVVRAEWSSERARWTRRARGPGGERSTDPLLASCSAAPATTATTRATRRDFEGVERFGGHGRPPAALARGPRLRRQARRRDRQRRDRRDARPGDGRDGRARDDAAALAELRALAARRGTRSPNWRAALLPAAGRLRARALEERADGARAVHAQPPAARAWSSGCCAARRQRQLPGRLRRRHALHPALRPVGPAHVPGPRRRPVRGDLRRATPRSSPARSRPSPSAACGSPTGASSRPTSSSPRPG